jgi:uncharacterized SAM-binding protein YcdF (DUF218 family)
MGQDVDQLAKTIWEYHKLKQPVQKSDAICTLCSIDIRVAERSAELYLQGMGSYVIFSGGVAHADDLLKTPWDGSEAEHFAEIAKGSGVPSEKILVENKAQNTGQNLQFTYDLLQRKGLRPASLILVQKPYMERRTLATCVKQWPDKNTSFSVTSPNVPFEEYFNDANPKELVINIMIGDLQRIKEYPKMGYQIEQDIPDEVWKAYEQLIELGFDKHLMRA